MLKDRSRRRRTETPIIGLIGGIASGKSYVAKALEDLGCVCIHADQVGHELLGNPMIQIQLRQAFGHDIFSTDGSVDRPKLGAMVFGDQAAHHQRLEQLNQIMHPAIRSAIIRQIGSLVHQEPVPKAVILDAALLLEAGWDRSCDWIIFVDTPDSVRRQRAVARGWTSEQWQAREAAQMPLDQKRRSATHFISGDMEPGELRRRLERLLTELAD
jgi:dephospho-CoA kinase